MRKWNLNTVLRDPEPGAAGGGDPQMVAAQAEIDRLKLALQAKPLAAPPVTPPAAPVASKKEIEEAFWRDPLSVSAAIATHAVQQARENGPGMDTLTESAKSQARAGEEEIWDKYYPEIEASVNQNIQPQFRANVTVWRNAFSFIKGQHMKDIVEMSRGSQAPTVRTSGDGPAAPNVATPPAAGKTKLTDEQRQMSKNLGVSEDGYRHGIKIIEEQHGRDASPWDSVITTESTPNRRKREQNGRTITA